MIRGRVNTGCVFLVSQMTHIQSLTNATAINRGRVNTGCVFLLSQMTHIQSLTNATGINRGRVNTGCVFLLSLSEICPVGFKFDSDNKICVGCILGYYKDVEGNSVNCVSCPANKTTVSVNSTSVGCNWTELLQILENYISNVATQYFHHTLQ
jgi:hypothetical protein